LALVKALVYSCLLKEATRATNLNTGCRLTAKKKGTASKGDTQYHLFRQDDGDTKYHLWCNVDW
jgi:hypothetical protein